MLIVDDEETIRWALAELFMQEGWEVHTAADGAEAAEMAVANVYDYMITDLKMPGRPGTDVIREARSQNTRMGVTVLTGYATVETAVEAVRLGAWDYVTKPCSAAALKRRIDEFLEQAGASARRAPAVGPLGQDDLRAFAAGEGTPVLSADPSTDAEGLAAMLGHLRKAFRDLGFDPVRAQELTQACVEAIAALSDGPGLGEARVALLGGRVLVGIHHSGGPPAGLAEALEKLRRQFGVQAAFVSQGGGCTVVLSEAI
jgi:ActR/RegA family two-component response regulator